MSTILLLEDDYELAQTLYELLTEGGYKVTLVFNAEEAIEKTYENRYDLYIFDVNLPDMKGTHLLQSLREAEDATPTIFISALVDLESIAQGFSVGGDDYVKKPFLPEELLIRINAKLANDRVRTIKIDDIEYDPQKRLLKKSGRIVSLGEVHLSLLHTLLVNANSIVDKSILLDVLEHPSDTALRVAINKLKKVTGLTIKNVRGVGYGIEL